jgi:hypothetical protein
LFKIILCFLLFFIRHSQLPLQNQTADSACAAPEGQDLHGIHAASWNIKLMELGG